MKKLKEQRAALIDEMEKLIEGKEKLNEEQQKSYDALEKKVKDLNTEIETLEKDEERELHTRLTDIVDKISDVVEKQAEIEIPGPIAAPFSTGDGKDAKRFSYRKMLVDAMNGNLTGIEKEMDEEGKKEQKDCGITPDELGVAVPSIIHSRATLQATVDAAGGYTVPIDEMGLIGTLRNSFAVGRAGATIMGGLNGDVKFPRRTADSSATWRSEGGIATQSDNTYDALTLTPNRLTAFTIFSRQLLRQSSIDVEAEVKDSLMYGHMNALEVAVFEGSGTSNEPTGLFASAINDGDHGSNGTILNWENIIQLERMVAEDNALFGSLAYLTNAKAAGAMKSKLKSTYQGGYIWEMFTPLTDGLINGYNAFITNAISATLTRGTGSGLSAVVFGNWKDLIIAQWGALEFIVNPYSRDTYDEIRVTGVGYFDLGLRHAESFAAIEGLET